MTDRHGISQKAHNDLVLSFLAVRRAIGALGFFLPLALLAYGLGSGDMLPSLSASYYSPMREVFVGTLIAQAVFLWSYEGFRPDAGDLVSDKMTARVAAVAIALVALVPTCPGDGICEVPPQTCTLLQCVLKPPLSAWVHLVAAAVFFGALAVYCLALFTKGVVDGAEKDASNRIYRICGWTIIVSIGSVGVLFATSLGDSLKDLNPVFWLETIATFAFATSWMVKGDALRPLVRTVAAMR
ncbi:hypothetical protein EYF88_07270 [Paracoccus sediminis]|uniref:DUF998 domain-containing protein n=1 Tax=Paracoccus sediminis TaxID=1214787 RepID=A0A238W4W3_9RHOB|nr:hypothetical protein [Paracoccus sediminis]TBN51579.1 hypothetical protein EYF88_07270 [Paracoccus sediminis]SNR41592.1 hypothetical protein SAMN06265378_103365 [Paracoccus sediminis]